MLTKRSTALKQAVDRLKPSNGDLSVNRECDESRL